MLDQLKPLVTPFLQDDVLIHRFNKEKKSLMSISAFTHQAIVIGRSSNINKEVNVPNVISDGIPVYRRKGGGCAVFLDPGNLIVSVVFPAPGFLNIKPLFERATHWLIHGLEKSGIIGIYRDGISDIVYKNRKVGGTCFYRAKGLAYFSASILVSADTRLLEHYLCFPPRTPDYRDNRAHTDFVTSLDAGFKTLTINTLIRDLNTTLEISALITP